jgi:hypothetical protein
MIMLRDAIVRMPCPLRKTEHREPLRKQPGDGRGDARALSQQDEDDAECQAGAKAHPTCADAVEQLPGRSK